MEEGKQIDESDEQSQNAPVSIDRRQDGDPNVTVESDSQLQKHCRGRRVTEAGRQIEESEEQFANADGSIDDS
jgi:hypothetical protein